MRTSNEPGGLHPVNLDAAYEPIASFAKWARLEGHVNGGSGWGWELQKRRLDSVRPSQLRSRAMNTVLRVAAAKTGEVEDLYQLDRGITISIGEDDPNWRARLASTDIAAPGHIDAQIATYEFIRRLKMNEIQVSSAWIRELHESVTRHQESYLVQTPNGPQMHLLPKGEFKSAPNHVIQRDGQGHSYCPVSDTTAEMTSLVDQLRSDEFSIAHPILQASYAHWAFTHIHPFADGNGRVARILASAYLFTSYDVPLLIYADRKAPYFQALEAADRGRFSEFVEYVGGRALDTLSWLDELEKDYANPPLRNDISTLVELVRSLSGLRLEGRDVCAARVWRRLYEILETFRESELKTFPGEIVVNDATVPQRLYGDQGQRDISRTNIPPEFELPLFGRDDESLSRVNLGCLSFYLTVHDPVQVNHSALFLVDVSSEPEHRAPISVTASVGTIGPMRFRLEDCSPTLSDSVEFRLLTFARRSVASVVQVLQLEIESTLRASGREQIEP